MFLILFQNNRLANDGQKTEKPPKINILGGFVFVFAGLVFVNFDPFVI